MPGAFHEIDYSQFDAWAIVSCAGLVSIRASDHPSAVAWLGGRGYVIDEFDFGNGIGLVVEALGTALLWEQQFGYALTSERRNLDALRDGFEWQTPSPPAGRVLVLHALDVAWNEDRAWLCGFLAIAREHARKQLALGRRYFTILPLSQQSPLAGAVIDTIAIGSPYAGRWNSA